MIRELTLEQMEKVGGRATLEQYNSKAEIVIGHLMRI